MREFFMKHALALAALGEGRVNPNPLVGAVVVKNNTVIGRGFHAFFGGNHAEVEAMLDARKTGCTDFSDATLYITLEPCCHYGKTPPCTNLIINAGIKSVVVGMSDPNRLMSGKGIAALRAQGIAVTTGILEKECTALNRVFIKYITTGLPYVLLKSACSLDGKIATGAGESKWISCGESRRDVQALRGKYMSVMCGLNTVVTDDPMLTTSSPAARKPVRIITDSSLSIPLDSHMVRTAKDIPTIIATCSAGKAALLEEKGITVIRTAPDGGRVDLLQLMAELGKQGIDGILLEGGGTLAFSALSAGIVDRVRYYIAPMLIGGESAKTAVEGNGFPLLAEASRLKAVETAVCGCDIIVEGDVCSRES
jgi:diaminohydroxyphosphoribosylaminopyrimidine deaminase/5-amino-6-(5-phosphoribosylamino)uracil reductase